MQTEILIRKSLLSIQQRLTYKGHREITEIDIVREKKWSAILEISQLAYHNPEINQKTKKVKMTRCSEKYGKQ